jgi:phosphoglycolate phosphatase-like HAD superfamily hydrolase
VALFTGYYGANIDGNTLRQDFDSERKRRLKNSTEQYPEINLEEIFSAILHHQGLHEDFLAKACCKLFRVMSRERFNLFPEVAEVLTTIKNSGYHLAAVSNAQRFSLVK